VIGVIAAATLGGLGVGLYFLLRALRRDDHPVSEAVIKPAPVATKAADGRPDGGDKGGKDMEKQDSVPEFYSPAGSMTAEAVSAVDRLAAAATAVPPPGVAVDVVDDEPSPAGLGDRMAAGASLSADSEVAAPVVAEPVATPVIMEQVEAPVITTEQVETPVVAEHARAAAVAVAAAEGEFVDAEAAEEKFEDDVDEEADHEVAAVQQQEERKEEQVGAVEEAEAGEVAEPVVVAPKRASVVISPSGAHAWK